MSGNSMGQGRPCNYTVKLAEDICTHLIEGGSLIGYCRINGNPGFSTVKRWLQEDRREDPDNPDEESFRAMYARARDQQADTHADYIHRIAERVELAEKTRNNDAVAPLMAAAELRKWLAGKMKPRKWGDLQRLQHEGKDGESLRLVLELPDGFEVPDEVDGLVAKPGE